MRRRSKNLLISDPVLERAEEYCRRHEIKLSRLVEDFLKDLPEVDWGPSEPKRGSPIVERLKHAAGQQRLEDDYAAFLRERWDPRDA